MTDPHAHHDTPPEMHPMDAAKNGGLDLVAYGVPHPAPFVCTLTVTDAQVSRAVPHVSNIEYVRWFDRAAELHSDAAGYTREDLLRESIMWFVARHEIDYEAETWVGDELVIATWVRSMKRVKSWRDSMIIRPKDEAVVARASTLWVLVDLDRRKPRRISPEMAGRFTPLENAVTAPEASSCTSP